MDDREADQLDLSQDPYSHDPQQEVDAGIPRVRSDEDFLNLPEGSAYFGPDNKKRAKHYTVTNDSDFMKVPEGAPYMGPDGIPREKPKYGDIGFTAQALHDIAVTPDAKKQALQFSYGDKVKTDEAGPYVQEDDGTIRRPGVRSWKSALGTSAANTLPAVGMVGGGILGGGTGAVLGSGVPVAGTLAGGTAGATAGAIGGAMAGRQANNVILSLLGIHQPLSDQVHSMGEEGLYTGLGEGLGRGAGKVIQYAKGPSKVGTGLPNDFERGIPGADEPAPPKNFATRKQQISEDLGGVLESMGITPEKGPFIGIKVKPKGSKAELPPDYASTPPEDTLEGLPGYATSGLPTKAKGDIMPNDYTLGLPDAEVPASGRGEFGSFKEPDPAVKYGYQMPGMRSLLGVNDAGLERIASLQKEGFKPAPSVAFPEAPMLTKIEQFDAAFNPDSAGRSRFGQSLNEGYNRTGENIITSPEIKGVVKEPLTASTEAVSYKEAGQRAAEEAQYRMALEDNDLADKIANMKRTALERSAGAEDAKMAFEQSAKANMDAAHNLIKAGIDQVGLDAEAAMRDMTKRTGSSDLINNIASSFREYNTAVRAKASNYYDMWDKAAGSKPVDVTDLKAAAENFFDAMPADLASKYPMEIRLLRRLAEPVDEEASAVMKNLAGDPEAVAMAKKLGVAIPEDAGGITMTAGELHQLRSWMRHGIDYSDLASDMSQGAMKLFEGKVNSVIQAIPQSELLNQADAFYKDTIPYMNNQMIKATMAAIKGGTGIDPAAAAKIFFKRGRAEDVEAARKVLGPNLWNAVEAAHIQSLIDSSADFGGIDAKKFATAVLADHKAGMLKLGYSEAKAKELFNLASDISKVEGKLSIGAPVGNESITSLLQKAEIAKAQAEAAGAIDPLGTFNNAVKEMKTTAEAHRRASPLNVLFGRDMSLKGELAARNILSSEDKIIAASHYLDKDTFDALRQVFVRDFLQREFNTVGSMRKELSQNPLMTDTVQALMFPGTTREQLTTLAKNAEFLSGAASIKGGEMSGSLAAGGQVMNPSNKVPGMKKFSKIPGVDFANRILLGKVYGALMEGVSHPAFTAWLTKSLESTNPAQRLAAKNVLNDRLKTSPWIGRALGQYANPAAPEPTQDRYAQ